MHSIPVRLTHASYDIIVGAGVFDHLEEHLDKAGLRGPFLAVSQPRIFKAVGQSLKKTFPIALIPDGERPKTLTTVSRLLDRMVELKKATVSTNWELVGGASSLAELVEQVESWRPDVVVIDEPLGAEAIQAVRSARERVRIVTVGALVEDADENASSLEEIRAAVLGLPKPGGPIR